MQQRDLERSLTASQAGWEEVEMNHGRLSVATRRQSNETICVVMKLHESTCHDPKTKHQSKLIPAHSERSSVEISALQLLKFTWSPDKRQ